MATGKNNKIMVLAGKESFIIRALFNKLKEAGYDPERTEYGIDTINAKFDESIYVVLYLETHEVIDSAILTFLKDRLHDSERRCVVIGDKEEVDKVMGTVGYTRVAKTFIRPLNANDLIEFVDSEVAREAAEKRKNILIVDDDPSYMEVVRDWLKDTYRVNMASSGTQAITWLAANRADLILLDYEMPVVTGPQVLEMLRSENSMKNIPVIFLTGRSDKDSVMKVFQLKAQGYLLKTIRKDELLQKLGNFFKNGKI